MARINLLPWREELRKQYLKEFMISIGVAVFITLVGLCGVHYYIEVLKDYQASRNKILEREIAQLNKKIKEIKDIETKKNQMLGKIEVIHRLQQSRPKAVHLFDELAKTVPEGVFLSQFVQSGGSLTMNGKSQSNARVSSYMRAIEASQWLKSPQLNIIKERGGQPGYSDEFIMRATQDKPKKKDKKPQVNKGRG